MTATISCDSSGVAVIVCLPAAGRGRHGTAARARALCRAAVPELSGIDTVIGIYPDLAAALSG